ncbi:cation:proton antiporter [Fuchsiella alkaliacetigena]|uniref:cation:proton antiporter n=1 Tax=Fuchsiella alkaliacetigena TaxID=957042 RepID=UPI00200A4D3A|nr:cation:proton antiporter [Fuchsiella alkaliacetigena]MCK8825052.1 cation:proton antiporter [Fuchsiella alkaliacetigena]
MIDFDLFLLLGGLMLLILGLFDYLSYRFNFSSLIVFILLGIGGSFFIESPPALHLIAEIGIVLLFFLLGLEFPLSRMMEILPKGWLAASLDVVFNVGISFLISFLFGLDLLTSFFIGAIVYASSSSITLKLLEEENRLANQETEFILMILIFEDLIAPILVSFFAGIYQGDNFSPAFVGSLFMRMILLTVGAVVLGHFVFKRMDGFVEKYLDENFVVPLVVGLALAYSGLAIYLGLSEVLGAFLAGIMLSEIEHAHELEKLILPLRNITLPFFFFWFGTTIYLGGGIEWPILLIALIVWSIIAKMLVAYLGGKAFGLKQKVALRGGFSLVQRGEFSAIIAALAPVALRSFAGIYIVLIAFLGVFFFKKAPVLSAKLDRSISFAFLQSQEKGGID